jgi:hypothetical protein
MASTPQLLISWCIMIQLKTDSDEYKAILQLEKDSDRAAAIVACTILELALLSAITDRLHPSPDKEDKLFRFHGPLQTFSSRIEIGFRLGLYGKHARDDLNTMRNIRNEFAHNLSAVNFDAQRIRSLCSNLKLVELHTTDSMFVAPKKKGPATLIVPQLSKKLKSPRERYILSAQVFVALLNHSLLPSRKHLIAPEY